MYIYFYIVKLDNQTAPFTFNSIMFVRGYLIQVTIPKDQYGDDNLRAKNVQLITYD